MAKKPARHKRMYSDSPKLERGEDGNMAAKKPSEGEKKADEAQSGDDKVKVNGEDNKAEPSEEARIQEIKDMHSRHEKEMMAIHKRHQQEDAKKYDNAAGDSNEKPDAGKKEIEEVRKGAEITE